jgi:murein L,D-transpeptidase YcbB/YkuD
MLGSRSGYRSFGGRRSALWRGLAGAGLIVLVLTGAASAEGSPVVMDQSGEIERLLTGGAGELRLAGEMLDREALRSFYQSRQWMPAWSGRSQSLTALLASASEDGLPTRPLHLKAIPASRSRTNSDSAATDLLLTDALLRYAAAMKGQRIDPTQIEDDWYIGPAGFDAVAFLTRHVDDVDDAVKALAPKYAAYQALKAELARLDKIAAAGGWPKVSTAGATLKPGVDDPRVAEIRRRLAASGELGSAAPDGTLYDPPLVEAMKAFQRRHGLADDGLLGRQAILALNATPAEIGRRIAINMERWRWLPDSLGDDHIVVNVPDQTMEVVEQGRAMISMRVIVGDVDHPTPGLHARMVSLVLNPVWRIPASIATNEILPKLQKDPGYLIANDLELVSDSFPPGSPESQGVGIDWSEYTKMPWPMRQRAGSDNALGKIKFNLPNGDDIYLHDTPLHKLFDRSSRALSHGCVRLQSAEDLALYVLRDKAAWTKDKLDQQIDAGDTKSVSLTKSLPVWLLYFTAWVDGDGTLQLRPDLYGRDQDLSAALSKVPAGPIEIAHSAEARNSVTPKICEGCRLP